MEAAAVAYTKVTLCSDAGPESRRNSGATAAAYTKVTLYGGARLEPRRNSTTTKTMHSVAAERGPAGTVVINYHQQPGARRRKAARGAPRAEARMQVQADAGQANAGRGRER